MTAKKVQKQLVGSWPAKTTKPPKLSSTEWGLMGVMGVLLLASAVLQLISFGDFRDNLEASGLTSPTAWAVGIIVAELWGAAGFFKVPLSALFRSVSYGLAVLAAGFWFVYNLQLLSSGAGEQLTNSGFFGRFLAIEPGWWSALAVSLVLFVVLYKVSVLRDSQQTARR